MESSRQVWSSINGYPGDYNYREFYRDIGYEADYDYIKPYIAHDGVRVNTGIKYYRITGKTDQKDYYDLQWAQDSIYKQTGHFFDCRVKQINDISSYMDHPPIILCPYDAELYGHWWYEGPDWLYVLFKKYIMMIVILNLLHQVSILINIQTFRLLLLVDLVGVLMGIIMYGLIH